MWMTDPAKMCTPHLLGEHVELHMFVGSIKKGTSMAGYIEKNLLEPLSLVPRHEELVEEMRKRGMKHKSPIGVDLTNMPQEHIDHRIDVKLAKADLLSRCPFCKKLHEAYRPSDDPLGHHESFA